MVGILLSGCGNSDSKEHGFVVVEQIALEEEKAVQEESEVSQETALDETLYIGEYLDENKEPNLEIAEGDQLSVIESNKTSPCFFFSIRSTILIFI